jgi:hypothetical protein
MEEYITIPKFSLKDLDGKTVEIKVGEIEGKTIILAKDQENKTIYVLDIDGYLED